MHGLMLIALPSRGQNTYMKLRYKMIQCIVVGCDLDTVRQILELFLHDDIQEVYKICRKRDQGRKHLQSRVRSVKGKGS